MKKFLIFSSSLVLLACNGGGGGSSGSSTNAVDPYPYQTPGSYNGISYSDIGDPSDLPNYSEAYFPKFANSSSSSQSKIAYGDNSISSIANLTAYVRMGSYFCSATPVKYDSTSNSTFLISAAHCFVTAKPSTNTVTASDLTSTDNLRVRYGLGRSYSWIESYSVTAVYVRKDYCQGATFSSMAGCPNFTPAEGTNGGQGNDIAIIQISGQYGGGESTYPQVVPANEYQAQLSMAPVFSVGYGLNTQVSADPDDSLSRGDMFYVANYFYKQTDNPGYHYLGNSFYNPGAQGYAAVICGGDSGGGDLFWTGSKWILLSEHTYGPANECGTFYDTLPNAATNVSAYYNWIQSIISSPNPIAACNQSGNCATNGV